MSKIQKRGGQKINYIGPYFNVAVDALGPETDFTLEKKTEKMKEKLLKTVDNIM